MRFARKPTSLFAAACGLIYSAAAFWQQPHTLTGDIRSHKSFHSKILNNDRDVVVYLPPGYESNRKKRYSVLYLHDGQNLFDGATSFIPGKEWRVDETAEALITAGKIEPLIIVGINNAGKDRIDEYTPAADEKYKMGGKADLYGRMLVEELKPEALHRFHLQDAEGCQAHWSGRFLLRWPGFYVSRLEALRRFWSRCCSLAVGLVCQ